MSMCISTAQARTNAFRLRSLAQNGCRGIGVRHLSSKFPQKGSSDMCMCISTAQDRTKCASRSWDRFFSSTSSSSTSSSSSSCSTSTSSSSSHHHHHHHHHQHHPLPRHPHPHHHHHHHHHEPHQYHHNYSAVSFCPPPHTVWGLLPGQLENLKLETLICFRHSCEMWLFYVWHPAFLSNDVRPCLPCETLWQVGTHRWKFRISEDSRRSISGHCRPLVLVISTTMHWSTKAVWTAIELIKGHSLPCVGVCVCGCGKASRYVSK